MSERSLGERIREKLLADAAVKALVGDRIFPQVAKQETARPYITYAVVSDVPEATQDGAPADLLRSARLQLDMWSATYGQAHQLARAVDNVVGALAGTDLSATLESAMDLYEDETQLHRVSADYIVWL